MLGTWFRCKYPHLMDGVIAGSGEVHQLWAPCLAAAARQATPCRRAQRWCMRSLPAAGRGW